MNGDRVVCEKCGHIYKPECPLCNHVEGDEEDRPLLRDGPLVNFEEPGSE